MRSEHSRQQANACTGVSHIQDIVRCPVGSVGSPDRYRCSLHLHVGTERSHRLERIQAVFARLVRNPVTVDGPADSPSSIARRCDMLLSPAGRKQPFRGGEGATYCISVVMSLDGSGQVPRGRREFMSCPMPRHRQKTGTGAIGLRPGFPEGHRSRCSQATPEIPPAGFPAAAVRKRPRCGY